MLSGFLQFITGSGQVPYGGLQNLKNSSGRRVYLRVHIVERSEKLPTAATCAKLIYLPNYKNYDTLKKKLEAAIIYGR